MLQFKTETIVGMFIVLAMAIFFYMSFQLGSFHVDVLRYTQYTVPFNDVAGLVQKADVKISGVKVGWVDGLTLDPNSHKVSVKIKVLKDYPLHSDAQAIVRQEGLLGAKFLELVPGSSEKPLIARGGDLPLQTRQFVSMDELFYTFQKIARTVEHIGESYKDISQEASVCLHHLKKSLGSVEVLLEKFSGSTDAFIKSFLDTADALKGASKNVSHLLTKAEGPVKQVSEVLQKIHEGEGSLGKLLHDTKLYEDVKSTAQVAKSCVERARNMAIGLDTHFEVLPKGHDRTNVKGYFDVWLYPTPRFFCLLGPVYSHQGFAKQKEELCKRGCFTHRERKRDSFALNLQVGANLPAGFSVRGGLFQGTAGFAVDWWLPFERLRWVSSFEAFDFKGHTRFGCDDRPYLKWINRVFFTPHVYLNFGANDFISKHNKSGFVGLGAAFCTADLLPCCR